MLYGYIIGIIYGLYFKISIAFVIALISLIYIVLISNKKSKIAKYLKIMLKPSVIYIFFISIIISNYYVRYLNNKYTKFYNNPPEIIKGNAVIIKEAEEKDYSYSYIIKMKDELYKDKKFILNTSKKKLLQYGDLIKIKGEYIIPSESRNYKGFNYREYLKSKKIYGSIKSSGEIKVIQSNYINQIFIKSNKTRNIIIKNAESLLSGETGALLTGILLGDKQEISDKIIENFKTSNLSHMLAVSGAHTSYIILGISYMLSELPKKYAGIITILVLGIFIFITNFTPSVIRACIMAGLTIGAKILYRKSDTINNIALSAMFILISNPFSILDIGFQLSYLGTLGIVMFDKDIEKILSKIKLKGKTIQLLIVTFSAQILIMPIMAYRFNTISLTFFISNLFASPILGVIIILGFITIFVFLISFKLAKMLSIILDIFLKLLILIAKFVSNIPVSSLIIKTPYVFSIVLIYILILIFHYLFSIYNFKGHLYKIQIEIIKKITIKNLIKIATKSLILVILVNTIIGIFIPKNMKIYFIDVGQGDSCLIVTPSNKKILIDGGEGKVDILLPYLLDRRIRTLDYVVISHFDSDHCNGLIKVIEKLKVKNIIISEQAYLSEEYINIANIINKKKIKVIKVKQGDKLSIDKDVNMDILYPTEKLEYKDLNNNSIVAKISYNQFSIMFTRRYRKIRTKYSKRGKT